MMTTSRCFSKLTKAIRSGLVILLLASCQYQGSADPVRAFSGELALRNVEKQLSFGPRYPGSVGHGLLQQWMVDELLKLGWSIEQQAFEHQGVQLVNVIATHPANRGSHPIILGAHYDTRRYADNDPVDSQAPVPGANDGASGVAVLLEIARVFSVDPPVDLVLAFFDAEDQGHIDDWGWDVGSRYFVEALDYHPSAVVIIDMIGDKDLHIPVELSSDPGLVDSLWASAETLGYQAFTREPGPSMIDDHIPFIQAGIPAALIIDFTYPAWHTTSDDLDQVSFQSLHVIGTTLEFWINSQESDPVQLSQ